MQSNLESSRAGGHSRTRASPLTALLADRGAVTAIEYALIAGIMAVAVALSVPALGTHLSQMFVAVGQGL